MAESQATSGRAASRWHAPTTAVGPEQADKKADQDRQLAEVRLSISPAQHVRRAILDKVDPN